jgi:ATP-binding cassette subfamily B protein
VIVVLGDGTIVEHGSHAELVARGGLYAELYELQARAYR